MDVKEAVQKAAAYVAELEGISSEGMPKSKEDILRNIRFAVEGTHYDESCGQWTIEVGFARKWDQASASPLAGVAMLKDNRTYKSVVLDDASGKIVSYGK